MYERLIEVMNMRYCTFCQNPCEDDAASCPACGKALSLRDSLDTSSGSDTSSGLEAPLPIWVTQKTDQPLDTLLNDDSLWDDSDTDHNLPQQDGNSHSSDTSPEVDIFDEIGESASLLFSNMSPKLKKILLITLITTLLSVIPFIYTSCTHQANPLDSLTQIIMPTTQNNDGAAVP
jgi:hypothetical protein